MFSIDDYRYDLPERLIAQEPLKERDRSRLLFLNRETGRLTHLRFYALYDLLSPADVLVINNTKVIPARLFGKKETGGKVEVLLLDYANRSERHPPGGDRLFECLVKASKRPKPGISIRFDRALSGEIVDSHDDIHTIKFSCKDDFENLLHRLGQMPLPPYIKRASPQTSSDDRIGYQTVYASQKGAVAAPTAGLHFSKVLLKRLRSKGVTIVPITLHVGYGTFLPVRVSDIRDHRVHAEWYAISKENAAIINRAKKNGCRVVAVGTTSVRTLEHACRHARGSVSPGSGRCDLYIYPGYRFQVVDAMITNFHLPRSTLLMLVAAFAGLQHVRDAYQEAVNKDYRFYSYGDAMFIA